MIPRTTAHSDLTKPRDARGENRADAARVLLAIGLLALLASFDDADKPLASAETPPGVFLGSSR